MYLWNPEMRTWTARSDRVRTRAGLDLKKICVFAWPDWLFPFERSKINQSWNWHLDRLLRLHLHGIIFLIHRLRYFVSTLHLALTEDGQPPIWVSIALAAAEAGAWNVSILIKFILLPLLARGVPTPPWGRAISFLGKVEFTHPRYRRMLRIYFDVKQQ